MRGACSVPNLYHYKYMIKFRCQARLYIALIVASIGDFCAYQQLLTAQHKLEVLGNRYSSKCQPSAWLTRQVFKHNHPAVLHLLRTLLCRYLFLKPIPIQLLWTPAHSPFSEELARLISEVKIVFHCWCTLYHGANLLGYGISLSCVSMFVQ